MRAYVQAEADEWEPETYQNDAATDSIWNMSKSMDACEQTSEDERCYMDVEDDRFEGSSADVDKEEAVHRTETQVNEARASE